MSWYTETKGVLGDIVTLAKMAKNLELMKKINELEERLLEGDRETRAMSQKITQLEDALNFKEALIYRDNAYWTAKGDGPYCSGCWDGKKIPMRLAKHGGIFKCPGPGCDQQYIINGTGSFQSRPQSNRRMHDYNPFDEMRPRAGDFDPHENA